MESIKLTKYSHGAGCGCKISPLLLEEILASVHQAPDDPNLLVGSDTRDDAAVIDIGNGKAIISTTDFFMPIVDDAFDFGRIASANAISDVYAMGGTPVTAIAVLGWPINELSAEIANHVIEGSRSMCAEAGITLAGGHSIDNPEPLFGLAVTGIVDIANIKRNSEAAAGCSLFLTKPLGVGILSTAQKKELLEPGDKNIARDIMVKLNSVGAEFSKLEYVMAMTDVTGFGLLGHLLELCEGASVNAELHYKAIPTIASIYKYLDLKCIPGGTKRNWESYGNKIVALNDEQRNVLCDPQTSGGLLVAVKEGSENEFIDFSNAQGLELASIGRTLARMDEGAYIRVQ
ncbi:MAG TPA: selenide, water dikinase SelD [Flavobacteriales bacterium]|nr:selenide, water dikinase SelD [Flavobacteriales bacterium]HIA11176.1 selenide, water dikinase SelD [Flavobacteriales bacterium]HIO72927.1 selenide, water dikinase SelD [Flavobacteriales bacterium]